MRRERSVEIHGKDFGCLRRCRLAQRVSRLALAAVLTRNQRERPENPAIRTTWKIKTDADSCQSESWIVSRSCLYDAQGNASGWVQ